MSVSRILAYNLEKNSEPMFSDVCEFHELIMGYHWMLLEVCFCLRTLVGIRPGPTPDQF